MATSSSADGGVVGAVHRSGGSTVFADETRLGGMAPSTFTQTYSTATLTHAAPTQAALTDSTSGTANTTVQSIPDPADSPLTADALRDDLVANILPALRNNFADLIAQVNNARTDLLNAKQVLNQVIDELQRFGFAL